MNLQKDLSTILFFSSCFFLNAQVKVDSELFLQLKQQDSILFEAGFNNCRLTDLEPMISEDLEFYHDQAGLTTTKKQFFDAVKNNICASPEKKPLRFLKEGTLQVFPLFESGKLYGAIQSGEHEFFIKEPGKKMYKTSSAKFTHVWLLQDGKWKLKRVLSFDHHSPQE